jgi:two-component system, sensor histidine kinase PdtaS
MGVGFPVISQTYQQLADSLIRQLPLLPNDTNKTYTYRDISYYLLLSNPDSALIFSRKGNDLAKRLLFVPGQIWNLNQQGFAHELNNNFDSAMRCYYEAIVLARRIGNRSAEARMLNVIGTAYYHVANFSEAIAYYDRAMQLLQEIDDAEGLSQVLNNLGILYRLRRNYRRATEIYEQSIVLKQALGDRKGEANTYRNFGLLYAHTGDLERSLQYLQQAIEIHHELGNMFGVVECEVGVGSALYLLGRYNEAEPILREALARLPETSTLENHIGLLLLGSIEVKNGFTQQGIRKMYDAYELVKPSGRLDLVMRAERELAVTNELLGQTRLAAQHWKNYAQLSDSLTSEQQQWAMEEMMARFESREKENLIQLQSLALAEESAKKKLFLTVWLLFVVLFAGSVGYAYNRLRVNRKLRLAHAQTQALLDDKEMLLKEMHHRVKNNLQMLNSLLSLQIREIRDEKALGVIEGNRSRLHSIALIHQLLYAREDFRQIDMQRFVNNLISHCKQIYDLEGKQIELHTEIDSLLLDIDIATPIGLIINELIVNAIKHAFPDGKKGLVTVQMKKLDKNLEMKVMDNGKGFEPQNKRKDSFGFKLINTLARKMEANLVFDHNNGTTVTYSFQLHGQV